MIQIFRSFATDRAVCVAVHGAYEYVKLLGMHKRYVKLLMEDGSRTKFSVGEGSIRVNPATDITWEKIFKNAAFFFAPDLQDIGSQASKLYFLPILFYYHCYQI